MGADKSWREKNAPKASSTTIDSNATRKVENVDALASQQSELAGVLTAPLSTMREFVGFLLPAPAIRILARMVAGPVEHTLIEIQILNDSRAPQLSE